LERSGGLEFVDAVVGGVIPSAYLPAIKRGVREAMEAGGLTGHPVVDVRVTVFDGLYYEVDSSEAAFKIAASIAFKEGVKRAGSVLLESIMDVEVVTPEEFLRDVIGGMSARRGRITRVTPRAGARVISARLPLAAPFRYAPDLLSLSRGRVEYTRPFGCDQEAPDQGLRHGSDDQTA
jgi:elongation factor G